MVFFLQTDHTFSGDRVVCPPFVNNFPTDWVGFSSVLETPNINIQWWGVCRLSPFWRDLFKEPLVFIPSLLKGSACHTNIIFALSCTFSCYLGFVNNPSHLTPAIYWAVLDTTAAVTRRFHLMRILIQNLHIVLGDGLTHVRQASIPDFQSFSVEKFWKWIIRWKSSIKNMKKFFSYSTRLYICNRLFH